MYDSVRKEKLFLNTLKYSKWDMQIKLIKNKLTGEKSLFVIKMAA